MAISLLAPAILTVAFAAAIALSPVAGADSPETEPSGGRGSNAAQVKPRPAPNAGTTDYSSPDVPQGWRNDAVWADPSNPGSPFANSKKRPPVIALD